MSSTSFQDIHAATPDLDALTSRTRAHCAALESASTVEACMETLRAWDADRCEVETYDALVQLRFSQDTTDAGAKSAREAWDAASPRWTELEVEVKRTLLAHPLREALESEVGAQAFALWESQVLAFDPSIKEDLAREAALSAEYVELCVRARFHFRGEDLTLSTLRKFRQDGDREVRHGADKLQWEWFQQNSEALDRIYGDLVALRTGMAGKLGFDTFTTLGYKRMCRVDYDRTDVERFRAEIVREVVPLATELHRKQAEELGLDELMAWDESVHDVRGNPLPKGDRDWMVARAREMFDEMGGGLDDFFRVMDAGGFLDLDSRDGKAGGGFCTSFASHGMPFVFANFNGTKDDVEVLTHEVGHAFQNYRSGKLWPSDYHWPTYESCEVHSMGLEFLTYPHMDGFFGEDGDRFRRVHLTESLLFLTYGTAVDHFQHLVYDRPGATPDERREMWQEMERTYMPWRKWGDLDYPASGGRWQYQPHIYTDAFYYIDYVLAQTCALQFWARAEDDRAGAMKDYVDLCARGGSAPFQELVRSAGLVSPFDEGALAKVVQHARGML